jgi:hypothetical protein
VRRGEEGALEVAGVGHQLAKGMKSGQIMDVSEVETSISAAMHTAEKMAGGDAIEDVIVSVGGSGMKSRQVNVEIDVLAEGVSDQDVADIIHEGCSSLVSEDATIIHCFPTQYMLDGARGRAPVSRAALVDLLLTVGGDRHILIDLIYNPEETRFLREGRTRGARTVNGSHMLRAQAEAAWELWRASGK